MRNGVMLQAFHWYSPDDGRLWREVAARADYEDFGRDGGRHRIVMPSQRLLIDTFLKARREYAYGQQTDYLDDPGVIGWTRKGDESHAKVMAVLMSDGPGGEKWMNAGRPHAQFVDVTEHVKGPVQANEHGWAPFRCEGGSVSVWVQE